MTLLSLLWLAQVTFRPLKEREVISCPAAEMGLALEYQGPAKMEKAWNETEKTMQELIPLARKD